MVRVHGGVGHVEEVLSRSGLWHPIGLGRKDGKSRRLFNQCSQILSRLSFSQSDPRLLRSSHASARLPILLSAPTSSPLPLSSLQLHSLSDFHHPDASRPGCFLTPRFMRICAGFVIVYLCKESHLAPISFVIKVTPSLTSVSPIVLGLSLDRLQVWCHKHVSNDVMATLV